MNKKVYIIDGNNILTTLFYGTLPRGMKPDYNNQLFLNTIKKTKNGKYVNGIHSMMKFILRVINDCDAENMVVVWDFDKQGTFRKKMYDKYKENRSGTPDVLKEQITNMMSILNEWGIPQVQLDGYEADDIAGFLSVNYEDSVVISKDKDYLQLVSDKTECYLLSSKEKIQEYHNKYGLTTDATINSEWIIVNNDNFEELFGLLPFQIPDLKAMAGDTSDNIPGIPGVGPDTAEKLLKRYKTIENIYLAIVSCQTSVDLESLKKYWKNVLGIKRDALTPLTKESYTELVGERAAKLCKILATINTNIPIDLPNPEINMDISKFEKSLVEYEAEYVKKWTK